jgi:predicted outer membrane repeat protein
LAHEASPVIEECQFLSNECAGWGGAIGSVADSYPEVGRCLFRENEAEIAGGAIFFSFASSPVVASCTFDRNRSFHGGAIECQSTASPTFVGCTFYRNDAVTGTAVRAWDSSSPGLENCILVFGQRGQVVFCHSGGSATLVCYDVFGNEAGDWVDCLAGQGAMSGNLTEDPLLCNPATGEYGLAADSPCAPENSNGCDLIGAWPVLCDISPVAPRSWGRIRISYR